MSVRGPPAGIAGFVAELSRAPPPLARIDAIERTPSQVMPDDSDFRIVPSRGAETRTGVVPDAATCPACRDEIFDRGSRRHRYPFTNCTHCGPRLSIIQAIPYDRSNTTMRAFRMCDACAAEYARSGRSPVPCPADRLPGLRPACMAAAGLRRRRRSKPHGLAAVRAHRGDQGSGRLPTRLRRHQCRSCRTSARGETPRRKTVRPDGARSRRDHALRCCDAGGGGRLCSTAAPIVVLNAPERLMRCPASRPDWQRLASCCRARRCIICCSATSIARS